MVEKIVEVSQVQVVEEVIRVPQVVFEEVVRQVTGLCLFTSSVKLSLLHVSAGGRRLCVCVQVLCYSQDLCAASCTG